MRQKYIGACEKNGKFLGAEVNITGKITTYNVPKGGVGMNVEYIDCSNLPFPAIEVSASSYPTQYEEL